MAKDRELEEFLKLKSKERLDRKKTQEMQGIASRPFQAPLITPEAAQGKLQKQADIEEFKAQRKAKAAAATQQAAADKTAKAAKATAAKQAKATAIKSRGETYGKAATLAGKVGSPGGDIASSALSGAALTPATPMVGAAVGGGIGILSSMAKQKRKAREAKAKAIEAIGGIRQKVSEQEQEALRNMVSGLQAAIMGGRSFTQ